jgi:hypothetical protein
MDGTDSIVKMSLKRFCSGLTTDQFIHEMTKNRELFQEHYRTFDLNDDDIAFLRELDVPMKVAVLAEDWCGDVIRYLPALLRMAEVARNWEMRVFYRDQNRDLMDMCLKEGKHRAIPVFIFYDEQMNEFACFTEKPAQVYAEEAAARKRFADDHPDWPDASSYVDDMSETTREAYVNFIRAFRTENRPRWQRLFAEEIKQKLQRARSKQVLV